MISLLRLFISPVSLNSLAGNICLFSGFFCLFSVRSFECSTDYSFNMPTTVWLLSDLPDHSLFDSNRFILYCFAEKQKR